METQGANTWMDCQYLVEANEALHECRYALRSPNPNPKPNPNPA